MHNMTFVLQNWNCPLSSETQALSAAWRSRAVDPKAHFHEMLCCMNRRMQDLAELSSAAKHVRKRDAACSKKIERRGKNLAELALAAGKDACKTL